MHRVAQGLYGPFAAPKNCCCGLLAFREDDSRIRQGFAAQNMVIARHIALNFLKKEKSKMSIRGKRKKAGWDDSYLLKVLADAIG